MFHEYRKCSVNLGNLSVFCTFPESVFLSVSRCEENDVAGHVLFLWLKPSVAMDVSCLRIFLINSSFLVFLIEDSVSSIAGICLSISSVYWGQLPNIVSSPSCAISPGPTLNTQRNLILVSWSFTNIQLISTNAPKLSNENACWNEYQTQAISIHHHLSQND